MGRKNIQLKRRQQIVKALYRCLLKKSYKDTTIKDIATEADINHGMLHYYFKEKEEILLSFVDYILNKYKNDFLQWRDENDFSKASQKEIMERFLEYVNEKITLNKNLSKVFISLWEISLNNRKVKSRIKNLYNEWIDMACETLQTPADDMETRQIILSIVAYLEGMAMFSVMLNLDKQENRQILQGFEKRLVKSLFP